MSDIGGSNEGPSTLNSPRRKFAYGAMIASAALLLTIVYQNCGTGFEANKAANGLTAAPPTPAEVFAITNSSFEFSKTEATADNSDTVEVKLTLASADPKAASDTQPELTVTNLEEPTAQPEVVKCSAIAGSQYSCTLKTTKAATYSVSVSAPFAKTLGNVRFKPGPYDITKSVFTMPTDTLADNTSEALVHIRLKDAFGNEVTANEAIAQVGQASIALNLKDTQTGTVKSVPCPMLAGTDSVVCKIKSVSTGNFDLSLAGGPSIGSFNFVKSLDNIAQFRFISATTVTAGSKIEFTITLKDKIDQPILNVTPTIEVSGGGVTDKLCGPTNSSGMANCSFKVTKAETKSVQLRSPFVASAPNTISVNPASASPAKSSFQVPTNPVVGDSATINILVKDQFDNPIAAFRPTLTITGTNNILEPCTSTNPAGLSTCKLTTTKAENKKITLSNVTAANSSFLTADISFIIGHIDVEKSTVYLPPIVASDATATQFITITPTDKYGNPTTALPPGFVYTITITKQGTQETITQTCEYNATEKLIKCPLAKITAEGVYVVERTSPSRLSLGTIMINSSGIVTIGKNDPANVLSTDRSKEFAPASDTNDTATHIVGSGDLSTIRQWIGHYSGHRPGTTKSQKFVFQNLAKNVEYELIVYISQGTSGVLVAAAAVNSTLTVADGSLYFGMRNPMAPWIIRFKSSTGAGEILLSNSITTGDDFLYFDYFELRPTPGALEPITIGNVEPDSVLGSARASGFTAAEGANEIPLHVVGSNNLSTIRPWVGHSNWHNPGTPKRQAFQFNNLTPKKQYSFIVVTANNGDAQSYSVLNVVNAEILSGQTKLFVPNATPIQGWSIRFIAKGTNARFELGNAKTSGESYLIFDHFKFARTCGRLENIKCIPPLLYEKLIFVCQKAGAKNLDRNSNYVITDYYPTECLHGLPPNERSFLALDDSKSGAGLAVSGSADIYSNHVNAYTSISHRFFSHGPNPAAFKNLSTNVLARSLFIDMDAGFDVFMGTTNANFTSTGSFALSSRWGRTRTFDDFGNQISEGFAYGAYKATDSIFKTSNPLIAFNRVDYPFHQVSALPSIGSNIVYTAGSIYNEFMMGGSVLYVDNKVLEASTGKKPGEVYTICSAFDSTAKNGHREFVWQSKDCTNGLPPAGSIGIGSSYTGSGAPGVANCDHHTKGVHYLHPNISSPTPAGINCLYFKP